MVNAIRIRTTIESENLRIPELAALLGRRVEVIVVEEDPRGGAELEAGSAEVATGSRKRIFGSLRGVLQVPADFDEPLPEDLVRAFEGDG